MPIATVNPATGETIKTFVPATDHEIDETLTQAAKVFRQHRLLSFAERSKLMIRAAPAHHTR